ncbi:GntR family transcriptional regulator [Oceanospirillum linum]|uniref:HTH gntR-type domain-containing protein n=1 Tax=Oceanospirillum linum TaxID=966 RepID=A0A1T1H9P2_OCELI|nr:GntR family transcriptional regulator [Oceanospirillum linum]OOV86427.1 hypothetical protein BTA35_0213005 [Oceanospirillum linum]SEG33129.1 DNA-binding transcriptional regulator, GntR family [Oleiphilus messinensis]SMP29170.1 DNA-binding transcriptional regulator, GntR family [Oceanospirillum linum]
MSTQNRSLSEEAVQKLVQQLKQAIGSGRYLPGDWLKQIDIEENFKVNRFTVRSALSELHTSGFLQHIPYKGYRVIEHSIQDRIAITEAREIIECAAAARVMNHIDTSGLDELERLAQHFKSAVEEQNSEQAMTLNLSFHRTFNLYCKNPHLNQVMDEMRERGVGGADRGWSKKSTQLASANDHINMVRALREKNLVRLQAIIYTHLNRWKESYKELIEP